MKPEKKNTSAIKAEGGERIQKALARLGLGSRREIERFIAEGEIAVNGKVVREMGTFVNLEKDKVTFRNTVVSKKSPAPFVYWAFHKPKRTLCSKTAQEGKSTIYEIDGLKKLKFPINSVGRLDYMTEGLLFLSNDGDWIHRLSHPRWHVPRVYIAMLDEPLTAEELKMIRSGITLEDGPVNDVQISFTGAQKVDSSSKWHGYEITVTEGRNRLIRRIFKKFGKSVKKLMRIQFGHFIMPEDLRPGEYRPLDSDDIKQFKKIISQDYPIDLEKNEKKPIQRTKKTTPFKGKSR